MSLLFLVDTTFLYVWHTDTVVFGETCTIRNFVQKLLISEQNFWTKNLRISVSASQNLIKLGVLAGWSLLLWFRAATGCRRGCGVAQVDRNPKFKISEQKSHSAAARAYRKWQYRLNSITVRLEVSLSLQDLLTDRHFVLKRKSFVNRTILQYVWHLGLLTPASSGGWRRAGLRF